MRRVDRFCTVDEFWVRFAPWWEQQLLASGARQRRRATRRHPSEIMTIAILVHQSGYRTFKACYTQHVQGHRRAEFPQLVSYQRFVALLPRVLVPLIVSRHTQVGPCTGSSVVDATALAVCENARIGQHKVFAADAARGKSAVGWCYGCTLHLAVNDRGEVLAVCLTPGTVDDRRPVPRLVKRRFGKLFGDRGYSSRELAEARLVTQGVQLITRLRKNIRNQLLAVADKVLLRKRAISETLIDQLKNICQIEHTRHRRPITSWST